MPASHTPRNAFPFTHADARAHVFAGAAHTEALARLNYIVESGRRCGVVTGPKGTGKSTLLGAFADELRRGQHPALLVDLTALGAIDVLQRLAEGLGCTLHLPDSQSALWRDATDALCANRLARRPVVVLFDHVDRAASDCPHVLRRLVAQEAGDDAPTTYVFALSGLGFPVIPREWRDASDLRIELAPFTSSETRTFVQSLLHAAGWPQDVFDASAAETFFRQTHGVAREIVRLCELSLLAAMRDDATRISGAVVEAAVRELRALRPSA